MSLPTRLRDRSPLLLLLVLLGPFLAYGVACSFDTSGIAPAPVPDDESSSNAYMCECNCEAPFSDIPAAAASDDDGEENVGSTVVQLTRATLRIRDDRMVGIRFPDVQVPAGAVIVSAEVQFTAGADDADTPTMQIAGEAIGDSPPLMMVDGDLSGRTPTFALAAWSPGVWAAGAAGPAQSTSDLSTVIQEIVGGGGWAPGNALTLLITTLGGTREAVAFDADPVDPANAPRLEVVYREPGVGVDVSLSVCMPAHLNPNVDPNMGLAVTDGGLIGDCFNRVSANLDAMASMCGYAAGCTCSAPAPDRFFDLSCNETCVEDPLAPDCSNFDPETGNKTATNAPGLDPVCLVASADPPVPVPDALVGGIFGRQSLCLADGTAVVDVPDESPRTPATAILINVAGDPCPGEFCDVGISYQAAVAPFSYEGGFLGAGDTTISEVKISGASVPGGVSLTPGGFGGMGPEQTFSSGRGRRVTNRVILSDIDRRGSFTGTNSSGLNVNVDWAGKQCSLIGDLFGGMVMDDDPDMDEEPTESGLTITAAVAGPIVNQPPQADAGADRSVECTSPSGATVLLDGTGSSDPDDNITFVRWLRSSRTGDSVGFSPSSPVFQGLDVSETYIHRVIDAFAQASEDSTQILVEDTTAPDLTPPPDASAECTGPEGTPVALGMPLAEDACDASVDIANDAPALFPLGVTVVTWTATDDSGNDTTATQQVTVEDTTPPEIMMSLDPTVLWPPNHKLRKIEATVEASDICDPDPDIVLVSIVSNEPDNDQTGDGNTTGDIRRADLGTDDRKFKLRAERKGDGEGRVYSVTYKAVDQSDNETPATETVSVPHDQGGMNGAGAATAGTAAAAATAAPTAQAAEKTEKATEQAAKKAAKDAAKAAKKAAKDAKKDAKDAAKAAKKAAKGG